MRYTFRIRGMHCPSCELAIKDRLERLPGCTVVSISYKTATCVVETDETHLPEITSILHELGYMLAEETTTSSISVKQLLYKIGRLVLAGGLVFLLIRTDISSLIPQYTTLSFGVAFIIGLVASVSSCLAVTGGLIMGYANSVQTKHILRTQLMFHGGRLVVFVIGGAILGLIGSSFAGSVRWNAIFSLLVGIVLLYIGLQSLSLVPSITQRGFYLPRSLSNIIFHLKNPRFASIVGAGTFLLPCGFTQSMQLFALQSGDPLQGALLMGAFALGTLPVLFGIGMGTTYITKKLSFFTPFIASLLVVFGVYTLYNVTLLTRALWGNPSIVQENSSSQITREIVQIGHDGTKFIPSSIVLAVGKNYTLVVTPSLNGVGCMSHVVIPGKGSQAIQQGVPFTIDVDGSTQKKIPLVCSSMGMTQGEIIVQ